MEAKYETKKRGKIMKNKLTKNFIHYQKPQASRHAIRVQQSNLNQK